MYRAARRRERGPQPASAGFVPLARRFSVGWAGGCDDVRLPVLGLVALLAGSGVLHFVVPAPYRSIVPAPLRSQAAAVVALSGAGELLCAALLLGRRTRRLGALATAALFVAVYPANIQMAFDSGVPRLPLSLDRATIAWLRLPLQVPLILWALRVRRS